jgi:hypothetical protein
MNDYWNDPPDDHEPPECCGEYMNACEDTGIATCATCEQRIEPEPDIEPVLDELPDDFADMDLRAWQLMIHNPSSTCGAIVEMMTAEFGAERVAAHEQHCRERTARLNPL